MLEVVHDYLKVGFYLIFPCNVAREHGAVEDLTESSIGGSGPLAPVARISGLGTTKTMSSHESNNL